MLKAEIAGWRGVDRLKRTGHTTSACSMRHCTAVLSAQPQHTRERVLRYPDGRVRRMRYPEPSADAEVDLGDLADSYDFQLLEDNWHPDSWEVIDWAWDVTTSLWDARPHGLLQQRPSRSQPGAPVQPDKRQQIPSTPAELLRQLNSEGYLEAQQQQQQQVQGSYEICLRGSPWVQTREVYVLATGQRGQPQQDRQQEGSPQVFAMRTRTQWQAAEDELSRVLGRKRADGSPVIRVEQLSDGVLMFEDEANAEQFASYLEADSSSEVTVAAVDAHEMFRSAQGARAVVVLFRRGCSLPMPDQLAVVLRSQQSLEDC